MYANHMHMSKKCMYTHPKLTHMCQNAQTLAWNAHTLAQNAHTLVQKVHTLAQTGMNVHMHAHT